VVVYLPFTEEPLLFMYWITLTVPGAVPGAGLLVFLAPGQLADLWRFLIATEAENEQGVVDDAQEALSRHDCGPGDGGVVHAVPFVVDIIWIKILTNPLIDV